MIEAVALELVTLMCARGQKTQAVNPILETKRQSYSSQLSGHILPVIDTI